jgi:uncharacterized protein YbjT (DUF2867 family)
MHILVIGGTGFSGRIVIPLLHDAGHTVTVFHRGTSAASLLPGVRSLRGDRHRLVGRLSFRRFRVANTPAKRFVMPAAKEP